MSCSLRAPPSVLPLVFPRNPSSSLHSSLKTSARAPTLASKSDIKPQNVSSNLNAHLRYPTQTCFEAPKPQLDTQNLSLGRNLNSRSRTSPQTFSEASKPQHYRKGLSSISSSSVKTARHLLAHTLNDSYNITRYEVIVLYLTLHRTSPLINDQISPCPLSNLLLESKITLKVSCSAQLHTYNFSTAPIHC